jgi:Heparinase II/III-like protein/Heparinase II/III N-terminus
LHPLLDRMLTYWRLGLVNIFRVAIYALGLKSRLHPVLRIAATISSGPFFGPKFADRSGLPASTRWMDKAHYFSAHDFALIGVPNWHSNPFRPGVCADANRPWYQIGDFDPALGDIKAFWETSRFEWLIPMAQRAAQSDANELSRLNAWLTDWAQQNPPYLGVNWKCGQETSIRVMHLAAASMIMGKSDHPSDGLRDLLRAHLRRIAPTMGYAIGQQNNHGTSEAAALFIGGSWLSSFGDREGQMWSDKGRRWLENRAVNLIEPDGTFSQYSVVYHRVMLDTYAFTESWRRQLGLPEFSLQLKQRLAAAVDWLYQLTDIATGDAPNLGANDGARLFPFSDAPYRDFRPSVQWAAVLFCEATAFDGVEFNNAALQWLDIPMPSQKLPPQVSKSFDQGGLHVLRNKRAMALLRYPRFRFRPSQADALHLDLWVEGVNILRDAGTYGYNCGIEESAYFSGVEAHNSVQFDAREQMPRLSRFLLGSWLRADSVDAVLPTPDGWTASASYYDTLRARHHRQIILHPDSIECLDKLDGNARCAQLRWRLPRGNWMLSGDIISSDNIQIEVSAKLGPFKIQIESGRESRHYLEDEPVTVLRIEVLLPNAIRTKIRY